MVKLLEGSVALVTGGSRGIGRAIAIELAQHGARIFLSYSSNAEAAADAVRACEAFGVQAEALCFDVADSAAVEQAIDAIKAKAARLDILVNNAGISKDGLLIRFKDEDWRRVLAVNLDGAFFCARAAAKIMMKQRSGRIITIGSVVGEMGNAGQVAYSASKSGLEGLTKSMAKELGSRNITVNLVTPGFIETEMTAALGTDLQAEYQKAIPLGRFGTSEEVAATVIFLASKASGYITGQVLGVNGGMYV